MHSQGPMATKPMIVRMTNSGARLSRVSPVSLSTTRRSGAAASRPPMPAARGRARRADGGGRRPCRLVASDPAWTRLSATMVVSVASSGTPARTSARSQGATTTSSTKKRAPWKVTVAARIRRPAS
jgi:hypothetical protein